MTPLRFASARRGLLAQRTFTSKSRAMLGAQKSGRGLLRGRSIKVLGPTRGVFARGSDVTD